MFAVALLAVVVGAGAGAGVVGPSNIEVFGWRLDGGSGQASATASSPGGEPTETPEVPDPAGATAPAEVETPEPAPEAMDPTQMVAEIVAATNAQRVAGGLQELAVSACATEQATGRVAQLVETEAFEHLPLEPMQQACGVTTAGENLAKGFRNGAEVVDGWMNSDGHQKNLLDDWTEIGVACQLRHDGQWLCAAVYFRA